jgi:AhpD family alkylhydroperoxidase
MRLGCLLLSKFLVRGASARNGHIPPPSGVNDGDEENQTLRRGDAMKPRIPNPALSVPGVLNALQSLSKAANEAAVQAGLPQRTLELVNLRASQINGCAVCLDMHTRGAKKAGETDERLFTLSAWRDTPYFTDAERAALALAEEGTRLADQTEPVSDAVFDEAAEHFDEKALGALVVSIAAINTWNRLNVITGQEAGDWTAQWAG